jgi:hypothetical protein
MFNLEVAGTSDAQTAHERGICRTHRYTFLQETEETRQALNRPTFKHFMI